MITELKVHEEIEDKLQSIGWQKLPEEIFKEHQLVENYFFDGILSEQIENINRDILKEFTSEEKSKIIQKVKNILLSEYNPVKVLYYMKYGVDVQVSRRKTLNMKLIDYKTPDNNLYHYGHEVLFKGHPVNSKPDFTLFINGIPVVIIEAKREFADYLTFKKAMGDIKEYEIRSPQLFNFVQFGVAYGDEKRYMATQPNYEGLPAKRKGWLWRNERKEEDIFNLIEPYRVTEIIGDFTYFLETPEKELFKIVPRYVQYFAVKSALRRIESYVNGEGRKNKGLIWHWQGSGKTYEIFYLAEIFIKKFKSKYPHVFIVVDRNDLEKQMDEELFLAVRGAESCSLYRKIESINKLKEILSNIKEQGKNPNLTFRGIYLVMAHKFRKDVFEKLIEEVGSIDKKEVLILRDEAHRTEYGILGAVRNALFPNALKFGFTGTPVCKRERDTFREFAYPEEGEFYLDKFFIKDSLRDGFTVPIVWRPVVLKNMYVEIDEEEVKREIEKFNIGMREVEPSTVRERFNISDILSSENRIKEACRYIANNIEEDTENFFYKALIVANSRNSCVFYKKYLDIFLTERFGDEAKNWSEIVMTYMPGNEISENIENYRIELEKKWGKDWQHVNDWLKRVFKSKENPKILIVTDMLLTGYDVPVLKVMYLDKLMYDHRLLQACARTNRPYKGKIAGLIVDLTGVLIKNYKDAIEKYNIFEDEDVKEDLRKYLFKDVEELWESFLFKFEKVKEKFKEMSGIELNDFIQQLENGKINKNEFEEIMSDILLKDDSDKFVSLLKDAVDLFKAVGSYHKKLKYINDVEWLKILLYSMRRKKHTRKVRIPWKEIKKDLLSKLSFDPFEEKKELLIGEFDVEKLESGKRLIADLLFFAKEKAEEEKVPIYQEIYKRLLEVKERFLKRQIEIEELLDEVKSSLKLARDYEETRKRLSKVDFILFNIKRFLNDNSLKLERTEETLRNIKSKRGWDFLPSDWDDVKLSLLMDLKAVSKDIKQRERLADELIDIIIKPIVEQHEKTH